MASYSGILAKIFLALTNLLILMGAFVLICIGCIHEAAQKQKPNTALADPSHWSTCLITFGVILAMITLFGFTAALNGSPSLLTMYAWVLMFFILLLGGAFVYVAVLNPEMAIAEIRRYYGTFMANYAHDEEAQYIVNKVQKTLYCCGDEGPEYWHKQSVFGWSNVSTKVNVSVGSAASSKASNATGFYPISCCDMDDSAEIDDLAICSTQNLLFTLGCFSPLQIKRYWHTLYYYYAATNAVILLLLMITCCLTREEELRRSKKINRQHAAHLETCRGGRTVVGPRTSFFLSNGRYLVDGNHGGGYAGSQAAGYAAAGRGFY